MDEQASRTLRRVCLCVCIRTFEQNDLDLDIRYGRSPRSHLHNLGGVQWSRSLFKFQGHKIKSEIGKSGSTMAVEKQTQNVNCK